MLSNSRLSRPDTVNSAAKAEHPLSLHGPLAPECWVTAKARWGAAAGQVLPGAPAALPP